MLRVVNSKLCGRRPLINSIYVNLSTLDNRYHVSIYPDRLSVSKFL